MQYRVIETSYGGSITPSAWKTVTGATRPGGGFLHLLAREADTEVILREPWLAGGGDVERTLSFDVDSHGPAGTVEIRFNMLEASRQGQGFRIRFTPDRMAVFLGDERLAVTGHAGFDRGGEHRLSLATLGAHYCLRYGDSVVAEGRGQTPFRHNEGRTGMAVMQAEVRLRAYDEKTIDAARPIPEWQKRELLYEETFDADSLERNWIHNHVQPGSGPELTANGLVIHKMCNSFLRQRFDAPLAVESVVRPVPTPDFPSEVTDAIVIWLADAPGEGLPERLEKMNGEGRADLKDLLDLPFYWIDFGGSNNVTTRLRKNPGRQLIRQFVDRPRLMERDRTYRLTVAQQNGVVEFHVDGVPMIRQHDAEPLTCGHVGVRAFCADLEVREFKVWRVGE